MPSNKPKFFLSYARKDGDFALRLGKDLRLSGADLWIDQLDVGLGAKWDDVTEEALGFCEGLILILSPSSVVSKNVKDEIAFALEESKQIIPVLHQPCRIPLRIRRLQHCDFTEDYQGGLKQIIHALNIRSKKELKTS